jgi:hypothetical protein
MPDEIWKKLPFTEGYVTGIVYANRAYGGADLLIRSKVLENVINNPPWNEVNNKPCDKLIVVTSVPRVQVRKIIENDKSERKNDNSKHAPSIDIYCTSIGGQTSPETISISDSKIRISEYLAKLPEPGHYKWPGFIDEVYRDTNKFFGIFIDTSDFIGLSNFDSINYMKHTLKSICGNQNKVYGAIGVPDRILPIEQELNLLSGTIIYEARFDGKDLIFNRPNFSSPIEVSKV